MAVASLTLAVVAAPASAHKGNPDFRSYVKQLTPPVPGVTLQVLNGDDRLELINRSNRTITVEGYNDEPYAQILADGTVRVNRRSPAAYLNTERSGQVPIPPSADANAAPQWRTIDRTRRFEWHDHRIHWMATGTPPQVKDKGKRTKVFDWAVPVQVGSQAGAIRGTLFRVAHPGGDSHALGVGLKPGLPQGTYTATYRVISADGHPVSGGLVFSIGRPGAAPAQTVGDLLGKNRSGPATDVAFGLARGLGYAAMALAVGGLAFLALVWRPALAALGGAGHADGFGWRLRRLLWVAVGCGLLTTLLGIVLQGATAGGISFWGAAKPDLVREVLGTRFGTVWGLRALAWAAFGLVLAVLAGHGPGRERGAQRASGLLPAAGTGRTLLRGAGGSRLPGGAALAALAVPGAALAITPALSGHASTQSPVALLLPVDVLHVVAMSVWLGGLALLLLAVPVATRALEPPERTRLLAGLLVRFSPLALGCVVALALTGVVQAYVHVRAWDALLHTAFGRAVVIKLVLLLGLVALGAVNRQRVLPGLRRAAEGALAPGAAGRLLRRTLRAEVALIVVVLGVTSALVSYAPPVSLASGPFSATKRLGPLDLELTIDPGRVGANELHLYLLTRATAHPSPGRSSSCSGCRSPQRASGRSRPSRGRQAPATTSSTRSSSSPAATGGSTSPTASRSSTSTRRR